MDESVLWNEVSFLFEVQFVENVSRNKKWPVATLMIRKIWSSTTSSGDTKNVWNFHFPLKYVNDLRWKLENLIQTKYFNYGTDVGEGGLSFLNFWMVLWMELAWVVSVMFCFGASYGSL